MKNFRIYALLVIVMAFPAMVFAQEEKSFDIDRTDRAERPAPQPSATPTPAPTSAISARFNYCAAGDTACEAVNRVRQDVDRPFTNGSEGVSIANATGTSGDIVIYLQDSTRFVVYDLRDRVHAGNPQPTWTSIPQSFKVQFVIHDANALKTTGECATLAVCETNMTSAMNGGFYIGRVRYRFQWNPGSVLQYINWIEPTSHVNINYKRDSIGQTWTVTPLEHFPFSTRYLAGMQVEDRNRISFGGQYNMPFALTITVK